ncbi:MAG: gliding motility-associated C-terminal domain-containing protein [Bacteroidota bacterium]|nr:gliding motility-associated C-terminal domain-containing protein [Bacteroidota bacterium]MDP4259285.1 gliding motility-associated C-terminal domain-containing protein [Bacteroidota bacterium]
MFLKQLLISCLLLLFARTIHAQRCTVLGQTPATAFPVCGSDTFVQKSVPTCVNDIVPTPCPANGNVYEDVNPYWYKFTCFRSGTLGLTIRPNDLGDDYDWQLFDVTGHDPNDVYLNASLFIGCNWSGVTGVTGTSPTAASLFECGSTSIPATGPPIFSKMPQIVQGHNYLLMISHFSGDSQSGYHLSFGGGTASITDTLPPAMVSTSASCDGTHITILLNKGMKCSTIASDGSDFRISPSAVSIVSASGNSCGSSFDMDSVTLVLSGPLTAGNYAVIAAIGTDGNTLLDNCDAPLPQGSSVPLVIAPISPTPMDSLTRPACAANSLQLVFSKRMLCSSVAPDGSDFTITGPAGVSVAGAAGLKCSSDGLSNHIVVTLSAPIVSGGSYQIVLKKGSDGNTLIDECGQETPAGSSLPFTMKDTVSAAFTDQVAFGCIRDTIRFSSGAANGIDQWHWTFDGSDTSNLQNPVETYSVFNTRSARLIVSNGFCSDTAQGTIVLGNAFQAAFEGPNILCPKDEAQFKNNSTGNIVSWQWEFGDGSTSSDSTPAPHQFAFTGTENTYRVLLIAKNDLGCLDTASEAVDVLKSCYIAVPSAFTPNGDGINDFLYPLNAYKADGLEFRVYNRYGQLVFESRDWTQKWDGRIGGQPQPAGTYVWTLRYTDRDSGKKFTLKGVSILIR